MAVVLAHQTVSGTRSYSRWKATCLHSKTYFTCIARLCEGIVSHNGSTGQWSGSQPAFQQCFFGYLFLEYSRIF